jgi:hypothetical protein
MRQLSSTLTPILILTPAVALGLLIFTTAAFAQQSWCPNAAGQGRSQAGRCQTEGEVTAVAPDLQLFSIKEKSGEATALFITRQTRITFPDGSLASMADLKEGQPVAATFRVLPSGAYVAESVSIISEEGQGEGCSE